ncbi:unnamed protein product [Nesidiocoris tenuis]|uniref:DOD-type homing endonuclease domain-containing protein n=1 Tax=Nesidiocoris tenuis TaxID=355587 RepID=A0A6H5GMC3_9HEMI|nr:unnamed protein product [Nesidiocoris tenuis]
MVDLSYRTLSISVVTLCWIFISLGSVECEGTKRSRDGDPSSGTESKEKSPNIRLKLQSSVKKSGRIMADTLLNAPLMFARRDKSSTALETVHSKSRAIANRVPDDPNLDFLFDSALKLIDSPSTSDRRRGYRMLEKASESGHSRSGATLAWEVLIGKLDGDMSKSVEIFEKLADTGEPESHTGLGFLNAVGLIGFSSDQARALVHYMLGALGGSVWAQIVLGYRYKYGVSVVPNCEKSLKYYSLAGKDVVDRLSLAGGAAVHRVRLMDLDDGKSSSYWLEADTVQYFELEAGRGNVNIQVTLGQMYYYGLRGCPRDMKKAEFYFNMAAKKGNPTAMGYLGKIHLESDHPGNSTAFRYFQMAAERNNPIGMSGLGLMYLEGRGVDVDLAKAKRYFVKAADRGWVEGQLQLGLMYLKGIGVKQDYRMAINYFYLAAHSGHIVAHYHLAQMHARGFGTMRSCMTAVELYKRVVERGKWNEYMVLGYRKYQSGKYRHAFIVYALLAELGYEVAQTNAAFLLEKGLSGLDGMTAGEKYARAYNYWRRAAVQGYSSAYVKMGDYHFYGLGVPVDYEAAAHHYRLASSESNPQALYNIGYMHEQGIGLPRDFQLAKRFYDLAATASSDAYVPVLMALVKLAALMAVDSLFKYELWEKVLRAPWDVYAVINLGIILILLIWQRIG